MPGDEVQPRQPRRRGRLAAARDDAELYADEQGAVVYEHAAPTALTIERRTS